MKSNSFLFLSLIAFFAGGFFLGTGYRSSKLSHPIVVVDNFDSQLTQDSTHPDALWGYKDSYGNYVVGFTPVPEKDYGYLNKLKTVKHK